MLASMKFESSAKIYFKGSESIHPVSFCLYAEKIGAHPLQRISNDGIKAYHWLNILDVLILTERRIAADTLSNS